MKLNEMKKKFTELNKWRGKSPLTPNQNDVRDQVRAILNKCINTEFSDRTTLI